MARFTKAELEAIKAARRKYQREWYAKHKAEEKERNAKYWLKKAVEMNIIQSDQAVSL